MVVFHVSTFILQLHAEWRGVFFVFGEGMMFL